VILEPDELAQLAPESDRAIQLLRFVPRDALGDEWFDRPYYLGPDEKATPTTSRSRARSRARSGSASRAG
jgi:non-homologous end joining protein Ku